jgi:hypothetical protein
MCFVASPNPREATSQRTFGSRAGRQNADIAGPFVRLVAGLQVDSHLTVARIGALGPPYTV